MLSDLWQKDKYGRWGASLGDVSGSLAVEVPAHGVRVYRAAPVSFWWRALVAGLVALPFVVVMLACLGVARRGRRVRAWLLRRFYGYERVRDVST